MRICSLIRGGGGDFTETDLYYSNYFDNADDDDADVLRSHASSSESEQ